MYYAYVHAKPDTQDASGIFYVGKGKGGRAYKFNRGDYNPHHRRTIEKYGVPLVGKLNCSSEDIAFDLEKGLIKCLRRMGVKLTNLSDGGEGQSGYRHSEETKSAIGKKQSGTKRSDDTRKKIQYKFSQRVNPNTIPEIRAKMTEKIQGRVWITNGVNDTQVFSKDIPEGWRLGRSSGTSHCMDTVMFAQQSVVGSKWVCKDGKLRRVPVVALDDYLLNGWKLGKK